MYIRMRFFFSKNNSDKIRLSQLIDFVDLYNRRVLKLITSIQNIIIMVKRNKQHPIRQQIKTEYQFRNRKTVKFKEDPQLEDQEVNQKKLNLKEKNKQSAQRSRENKKKYIQQLETKVRELTIQNQMLKEQLKSCKCGRTTPKKLKLPQVNQLQKQQSIPSKIKQDELYDRDSVKSNQSYSNFLMLTIILILGIFGCYDVNKEYIKIPSSLYNVEQLKIIIARYKTPQNQTMYDKNRICKKHQILQNQYISELQRIRLLNYQTLKEDPQLKNKKYLQFQQVNIPPKFIRLK